jgi:hypothetical protein
MCTRIVQSESKEELSERVNIRRMAPFNKESNPTMILGENDIPLRMNQKDNTQFNKY